MRSLIFFSIYLNLPAALDPGVHSAYNRNKYQKQKEMFLESRAWPALKAARSPPTVSLLSSQFRILNISQPYRTPRPVTGLALFILGLKRGYIEISKTLNTRSTL
jgi:hypothetical protein